MAAHTMAVLPLMRDDVAGLKKIQNIALQNFMMRGAQIQATRIVSKFVSKFDL